MNKLITPTLVGRLLDASRQPVSGFAVDLIDSISGAVLQTYVTGPDGAWRFNLAADGEYVVKPQGDFDPPSVKFNCLVPGADFVLSGGQG